MVHANHSERTSRGRIAASYLDGARYKYILLFRLLCKIDNNIANTIMDGTAKEKEVVFKGVYLKYGKAMSEDDRKILFNVIQKVDSFDKFCRRNREWVYENVTNYLVKCKL